MNDAITPDRLANLADEMDIGYQGFESGRPDYPICVDGQGDFYFWPHLQWGEKGGCGELLEWMIVKIQESQGGKYPLSLQFLELLPSDFDAKEAIVLAAMAYAESK